MIRPMLAFKKPKDWTDEQYLSHIESHLPLIVQPKLDGIRCIIDQDGLPRSRTWKLIPNRFIRQCIKTLELPYGLDGELLIYEDKKIADFNKISSAIMSEAGEPNFTYKAFDLANFDGPFIERHKKIEKLFLYSYCGEVLGIKCNTIQDLLSHERDFIKLGFEGLILRKPNSPYKQGRPTSREFYLAALKRFEQSEATIIGFEEKLTNLNVAVKSEQGFTDRSSHASNMKGADTLGALIVRDIVSGVEFNVGSGFDDAQRRGIWNYRENFINSIITYRYQANRSKKDKPISPTFVGFRNAIDL